MRELAKKHWPGKVFKSVISLAISLSWCVGLYIVFVYSGFYTVYHMHTPSNTNMYTYTQTGMYICVNICLCVFIYMYTYIQERRHRMSSLFLLSLTLCLSLVADAWLDLARLKGQVK